MVRRNGGVAVSTESNGQTEQDVPVSAESLAIVLFAVLFSSLLLKWEQTSHISLSRQFFWQNGRKSGDCSVRSVVFQFIKDFPINRKIRRYLPYRFFAGWLKTWTNSRFFNRRISFFRTVSIENSAVAEHFYRQTGRRRSFSSQVRPSPNKMWAKRDIFEAARQFWRASSKILAENILILHRKIYFP